VKGRRGTNMYTYLTHRDRFVASRDTRAHIYHLQALLAFELQLHEHQAKGREDMEGRRRANHDDDRDLGKQNEFAGLARHNRCSYWLSAY